jgi:hypothetical protein
VHTDQFSEALFPGYWTKWREPEESGLDEGFNGSIGFLPPKQCFIVLFM